MFLPRHISRAVRQQAPVSLVLLFMFIATAELRAQNFNTAFDRYPVYSGSDLGLKVEGNVARFRMWSPMASRAELLIYDVPTGGKAVRKIVMRAAESGTWQASAKDAVGKYYAFRVMHGGNWSLEVPDPYVMASGINGKRGYIISRDKFSPEGWEVDRPVFSGAPVDAVIYELHIRDASIAANSGVNKKGGYNGLAESGTKNPMGQTTGLDHIAEMGVTHVHLLPFFDFLSVDESKPQVPQYNWGYEPLNYNVPEGSYSSNANDPVKRIIELKKMIMAFHAKGLSVVMDVVYNHTMLTKDSYFNQLVPGYYYRQSATGGFSDASACGNETASERPMMRKFILESLEYWVREYHIDGFRFDLMGIHDIETMNEAAQRLRRINPNILLYGEGWTAGHSPLPDSARALKKNAMMLDDIAVFSDDLRDGIKGSVFLNEDRGFVSGKAGMESSIRFGVTAACPHDQVNYDSVNYSRAPYARHPGQVVSYAECHDNHVLFDKLSLSVPGASEAELVRMHELSLAIVLTSQGIPFLHAGTEFLRTKQGNENSYNAGDSINAIDWSRKSRYASTVQYVRNLISLRKSHPAFRMKKGEEVTKSLRFIKSDPGIVAYTLDGAALRDTWKNILVVYNANTSESTQLLPPGNWHQVNLRDNSASKPVVSGSLTVPPVDCVILYQL